MSRVLLLITGLNQGGAESQVIQLCLKLKNNGNDVQLVTMVNPVQSIASLEAAGIEVFSLAMRPGFPDPRAIWRFALCIRKFQPDVVHSHMVHANLLARISRLFTRMPKLICTAHNMNEGGRLREWLYRVSDPLCNMTTNVSEDAVQRYIQIKAAPSNKILYMPNGVDLQHFADRHMITAQEKMELRSLRMQWNASDQFIWLAVGRLVPEKDYAMMLSSFKRVVGYDNKALLLIVGEGPEHDKLRRLVQENGLESFVVFLGIRQDIPIANITNRKIALTSIVYFSHFFMLPPSNQLPIRGHRRIFLHYNESSPYWIIHQKVLLPAGACINMIFRMVQL